MRILMDWVSNHSLLLLLAVGTLFTFLWQLRCRNRLGLSRWTAAGLAVLHTVFGVFTVAVFAVVETMDLSSWGKLSLFGAVFLMPLLYMGIAKVAKRKPADVFDVFTICLMATLMCARTNCILTGCCQGSVIPGTDSLRWPTRELEILFYIGMLFLMGRRVKTGKSHGEIYPMYMIFYGAFRFLDECFREASSPLGFIHLGHIWALISLAVGLSIYYAQKSTKEKATKKETMKKKNRR